MGQGTDTGGKYQAAAHIPTTKYFSTPERVVHL